MDLGLSVALEGSTEDMLEMCRELNIKPHSINMSLEIWGKKEDLPEEKILEFVTMCGHCLIAKSLVVEVIGKVRSGKMTPEAGTKRIGTPCVCGFYNPERALKKLKAMAPK